MLYPLPDSGLAELRYCYELEACIVIQHYRGDWAPLSLARSP